MNVVKFGRLATDSEIAIKKTEVKLGFCRFPEVASGLVLFPSPFGLSQARSRVDHGRINCHREAGIALEPSRDALCMCFTIHSVQYEKTERLCALAADGNSIHHSLRSTTIRGVTRVMNGSYRRSTHRLYLYRKQKDSLGLEDAITGPEVLEAYSVLRAVPVRMHACAVHPARLCMSASRFSATWAGLGAWDGTPTEMQVAHGTGASAGRRVAVWLCWATSAHPPPAWAKGAPDVPTQSGCSVLVQRLRASSGF